MNVLVYGLNFTPEPTGTGKYTGEMAAWLAARGDNVTVITANPYYPDWKIPAGFPKFLYSSEHRPGLLIKRCPLYVPRRPGLLSRLLHLASFAFTSFPRLFALVFRKFDVVITISPTLFCAPAALLFCKLNGATALLHVQDFEFDAMMGLAIARPGDKKRAAQGIESWLLRRFDAVSVISGAMLDNAAGKGVARDRLFLFPNWSEPDFITPDTDGRALKRELGFADDDRIILYAGNIGLKQDVDTVLSCAESLAGMVDCKFLFVGAGPGLDYLERQVESRGISNVFLGPLLPWSRMPELLAMADVHLVIQKPGLSGAMLPSKLVNILAAGGHALVMAESGSELERLGRQYPGIYMIIKPGDGHALLASLQDLLARRPAHHNEVARRYAELHLDRDAILAKFRGTLEQLARS